MLPFFSIRYWLQVTSYKPGFAKSKTHIYELRRGKKNAATVKTELALEECQMDCTVPHHHEIIYVCSNLQTFSECCTSHWHFTQGSVGCSCFYDLQRCNGPSKGCDSCCSETPLGSVPSGVAVCPWHADRWLDKIPPFQQPNREQLYFLWD